MAEKKATEATAVAPCFTKEQLLASKKYASRKDLIGALLASDKTYTTDTVDAQIEKYLKGQVR